MAKTTSYTIGEHYNTYIGNLVASGRYKTASEVITDALRHHETRITAEQRLSNILDEAMDGPFNDFDPQSFIEKMRVKHSDQYQR